MLPIEPGAKNLALSRIKNGDSLEDISTDMDIHMVILREWEEALGDNIIETRALDLVVAEKAAELIESPNTNKELLANAVTSLSITVMDLAKKNVLHRESLDCLKVCSSIITDIHKTLSDQNGTTIINQAADGNDTLSMFNATAKH